MFNAKTTKSEMKKVCKWIQIELNVYHCNRIVTSEIIDVEIDFEQFSINQNKCSNDSKHKRVRAHTERERENIL